MPATAANPTGVNPFNGMSDDSAGASAFERMYEAGALDSQDPRDQAVLQAERAQQKAQQAPDPTPPAADQLAAEPSQEDSGKATAAPETPEYVNLDDYLQKSGLERDSFLTLPVRLGEQDLPLSEVLKRAEAAQEVESRTSALTAKQQAFEAEQAKQTQALQQQLTQAQQLGQLAYSELQRDYQAIDWNSLSQSDPGRWAVLNTQFQQRHNAITGALQQIQAKQQEAAQGDKAKAAETLKAEHDKLVKAMPEWRDPAKFKAARQFLVEYATSRGVSAEQVDAINQHNILLILHDAAQWQQQKSQQALALKKVRAAPQISSPGTRAVRDPKVTAIAEARTGFHKTPKSLDAQLAFANRIAENL